MFKLAVVVFAALCLDVAAAQTEAEFQKFAQHIAAVVTMMGSGSLNCGDVTVTQAQLDSMTAEVNAFKDCFAKAADADDKYKVLQDCLTPLYAGQMDEPQEMVDFKNCVSAAAM